jgi:hypothetical protein
MYRGLSRPGVNGMADSQEMQQKLDKVIARYPKEQDRIGEVARKITEMDRAMVTKAFEHALEKIIDAKTPLEAKSHINTLDQNLISSSGFSSIGKLDKRLRPFFETLIKVFFAIGILSVFIALILMFLGR